MTNEWFYHATSCFLRGTSCVQMVKRAKKPSLMMAIQKFLPTLSSEEPSWSSTLTFSSGVESTCQRQTPTAPATLPDVQDPQRIRCILVCVPSTQPITRLSMEMELLCIGQRVPVTGTMKTELVRSSLRHPRASYEKVVIVMQERDTVGIPFELDLKVQRQFKRSSARPLHP